MPVHTSLVSYYYCVAGGMSANSTPPVPHCCCSVRMASEREKGVRFIEAICQVLQPTVGTISPIEVPVKPDG